MCAPLRDFKGNVRYFLGAQVDVSGLASDFVGLEYLEKAASEAQTPHKRRNSGASCQTDNAEDSPRRCLRMFSEMLNDDELDVIRKHGGRMHRPNKGEEATREKRRLVIAPQYMDQSESDHMSIFSHQISIPEFGEESSLESPNLSIATTSGGYLGRVYEHYVLIRPAPSLRILFASPSLRIPGLLQSSLLDRIGGPARVREQVIQALVKGQSVTASRFSIHKLVQTLLVVSLNHTDRFLRKPPPCQVLNLMC